MAEKAQEATSWMEQHGRILDALRSGLIPEIKECMNLSSMQDALYLTSAVLVAGVPLTIVPEPTQAQCHDIDREVSQLIGELDHGLSCAVTVLQAYSLALQRILPLNYLTTSPLPGWAQVLQLSSSTLSSDILSITIRQAAELLAKSNGDDLDTIKCNHDDLCLKMEKNALEIEKVEEECAELVNSIGSETESKAKDRLLSAFMKYMQSAGLVRKEDNITSVHLGPFKHDGAKEARFQGTLEEKKDKVLSILNIAVSSLYDEVKHRIVSIFSDFSERSSVDNRLQPDFGTIFCKFEEQVEKCILVAGFANELQQVINGDIHNVCTDVEHPRYYSEKNWASIFKTSLLSCKSLVGKMTEDILPDVIKLIVSFNSDVMDAFGSLSQIRGSIDMALEQLVEVEIERASLVELEQNYFVKVGAITEQKLVLEEAALKGRDHLSWEEAEELASQEEACRAQLDQLHQTWNQKDRRTSSLIKKEAVVKNALVSTKRLFQSLIIDGEEREPQGRGGKGLLAKLVKPFSELESIDKALSSVGGSVTFHSTTVPNPADLMSSAYPMSEYIWKFDSLLNSQTFFVWEIGVMDSFLDSCIHDVASSVDQSLGFDQLFNVIKKKLEIQLQKYIVLYLKEHVAPILLAWLDREKQQLTEAAKELVPDQGKKDHSAVKKVRLMLEEYCNAHETEKAARSAASFMKRQVNELQEAVLKTSLEIVQMEWMHDVLLTPSHNSRVIWQKFIANDDNLYPIILNLNRPKLLESLQSAVSKIARSVEFLQACERTSMTAEGQLERAMGWACGGPNSNAIGNTSTKSSGIPPEFNDHLTRRKKLLWEVREKASDIVKICISVLEFEASRDGIFRIPGGDGRTWQQSYFNSLTRLDIAYHSFTRE